MRGRVTIDDVGFKYWGDDAASYVICNSVSANGRTRNYEMFPCQDVNDPERWLHAEESLVERVFLALHDHVVKGRMVLRAWFVKQNSATGEVLRRELLYLSSLSSETIHDFDKWYSSHVAAIMKNFNDLTRQDSDLTFDGVEALEIKFNLLPNLAGRGAFQLPPALKRMHAVVNVQTTDSCFKYALLSVLHYNDFMKAGERKYPKNYMQWLEEIDFGTVNPSDVSIKDVHKIESLNNLKINIHVWDKGLQGPVYNNAKVLAPKTINLLLIVNSEGERHYCGIPSLKRLYYHQKSSHQYLHVCERCIRFFINEEQLDEHFQWCARGKLQVECTPKETSFTYNAFNKELSPSRIIYADIESYIHEDTHFPASIASYTVWHSDLQAQHQHNSSIQHWSGEGCIIHFLHYLESVVQKQQRQNCDTRKKMKITPEEQADFDASTHCSHCKILFDETTHKKCRDHCHLTGKFRSALCNKCNFKLSLTRRTLPVIFHNLKSYDAHQLIKHGLGKFKHWDLSIIPQTKEKYMTITAQVPVDKTKEGKTVYFKIVFLDSFQFMSSSLASLANNLDNLPFTEILKRDYPNLTNDVIQRKGVFPYSYFNSLNKLQETCLPTREAFRNDLNGEACSEEDYRFAQRAWREFDCHTFGDYLLVYLKLDVLLLACVFEKFRQKTLEEDGLDPVHFVSLPGLSFLSAFKMTGEKIDLLNDLEMYSFFERGIRGGMTFVNKHRMQHEKVTINNMEYMQHLAYIDQNNLYGNALRKALPHSEFSWVEDLSIFTHDFILSLDEEGEWGYTFEVDLGYPKHIHHSTADFPLAPETGEITYDMFSIFMKEFHHTLNPNQTYKTSRKLLLTQYNKEHYFVHFAVLKFYLEMGLTLDKVHRVIKYKQKAWLKEYIDFNSQQRALSRNDFDKAFYKLKNNALFGKTMEDVRKRLNYKLVTDEDKFVKLARSPFFYDRDIITEDIVGVHMLRKKVTLDKPIFVGQAVLDYSKLEMYQLYYKNLPQCPLIKKLELVGGDTDSFFLTIATDINVSLSDVFHSLSNYIDTSNYPPSHPLYSIKNKAKLGCFKDETAGEMLEEMILLRPKMYSMKYRDSDTAIKRAKGISKHIVKKMKHDTFREAFENQKTTRVQMTILRSTQHTIQTTTFNKRALSAWEDKRIWLNENESLPHGHVDSPVPLVKRRRLEVPVAGDVSE